MVAEMPSERHDKGYSAARRRSSKTTATSRSTRSDVKQQSAQEQQGRENREDPFFHTRGFENCVQGCCTIRIAPLSQIYIVVDAAAYHEGPIGFGMRVLMLVDFGDRDAA